LIGKKKALILFLVFDILAVLVFWMGYNEINKVVDGIANSADTVEFNHRVGFFFIGVLVPMIHLLGICEYFWPKVIQRRTALFSWSALILLIVLFAGGFYISARVRTYVERAGYLHCSRADSSMTFSVYLVYTKDDTICSQIIEEKRKPRSY